MSVSLGAWGMSFRRAGRADRSLAGVGAFAFASLLALSPWLPAVARFAPACPFHALTGMPCPGCGATRAALALARGDLPAALAWNPLATLALVGGLVAAGLAPAWVALEGPLPVLAPVLPARARAALVAMIALDWAYLVTRGV